MEVLVGISGTICIIAGIVFAFGGALGNSVPTVLLGAASACLGITGIFCAAGWTFGYALAAGVILPVMAWVIFWHIAMPGRRG